MIPVTHYPLSTYGTLPLHQFLGEPWEVSYLAIFGEEVAFLGYSGQVQGLLLFCGLYFLFLFYLLTFWLWAYEFNPRAQGTD